MSRRPGWLARHWLTVASPVALLIGWEVASAVGLLREAFFPRPSTVLVHLRRLVADGTLQPGIACDDGAGAHFADDDLAEIVSDRLGATGYRVEPDGHGSVTEVAYFVRT